MNRVSSLLRFFVSFEFIFVSSLMAGRFKADPRFSWMPVDWTLLFWVGSLTYGMYLLALRQRVRLTPIREVLLFSLLSAWLLSSIVWAPPTHYGMDKVLRFLIFGGWGLVATAFIISTDPMRINRFFYVWLFYAAWLSLESYVTYLGKDPGQPELETVLGGNYLGVGRVVGPGILFLLSWILCGRHRTLGYLGIMFFAPVLVVVGGRGPALATVMAAGFALVVCFKKISRFLSLLVVVGLAVVLTATFFPQTTVYRLTVLLDEPGGGTSVQGRLWRWERAWEQFAQAPFVGQGAGSFYFYHGDPSLPRDYPHNIFLEMASEAGLVGVLLFTTLLIAPFLRHKIGDYRRNMYLLASALLLVNTLVNALVSGDIADNRLLLVAVGLLAGLSKSNYLTSLKPGGWRI